MQETSTDELTEPPAAQATRELRMQQVPASSHPMWIVSALLILCSPIVVALLMAIFKIDRTVLLAAQYAGWCVAAYMIAGVVPRKGRTSIRIPSRMTQFLLLFLISFAASSFSIWLRGTRADSSSLALQSLALIFMALPFFSLKSAANAFPVDRGLLWICHAILAFGLYSVVGDFFGIVQHEGLGGRYFGPLGDQIAWPLSLSLVVYFASRRIPLAFLAGLALALTASRGPALISISANSSEVSIHSVRKVAPPITTSFMGRAQRRFLALTCG